MLLKCAVKKLDLYMKASRFLLCSGPGTKHIHVLFKNIFTRINLINTLSIMTILN